MRMYHVDRETLARDLYNVYREDNPSTYLRSFDNISKQTQERWRRVADFVLSGSLLPTEDPRQTYLELGE